MASAQDILNAARSLIGVHETPDGSNVAHPITDWATQYGYSVGDAWCSWTVSYEFYHVEGGPALIHNHPSGYSGDFRTMGARYGLLIPGPRPGAIDVMDFDGKPDFTDHVGIVESVNSDGSWVNIEGNHLNQVMRVRRTPGGGSHWFVLPKYSEGSRPVPTKPEEDDDDMVEIQTGAPKRFPAMPGAGKKTFFDLTDESKSGTGAKVRLSARRDFTAKYPNGDWTKTTEGTVKTESSFRFEGSQYFGVTDEGYTVKIEVLTGGPVGVTRKQTMG